MCACRLCAQEFETTWQVKDAKSGETLKMALCGACGLVQQAELPCDHDLRIYYSHHYREDYKSTHRPKLKYVFRAGRTAVDRLALMASAGVLPKGQRLLDIGAGGGEFCYMARRAGFDAVGVEPHQGYSEFAREAYGIDISTCGVADLAEGKYDVVTMFHVFEHLAHPLEAMRKIWSALSPNGHLVIEVPNIHQADASPHNIYFKAHLFYYSRFSLIAAVSQYFTPGYVEDRGNLTVVFRRRDVPIAEIQLPSPDDVARTRQRLREKGWSEYLLAGGGLAKPFVRLGKIVTEARLKPEPPRDVLDRLWTTREAGANRTGDREA